MAIKSRRWLSRRRLRWGEFRSGKKRKWWWWSSKSWWTRRYRSATKSNKEWERRKKSDAEVKWPSKRDSRLSWRRVEKNWNGRKLNKNSCFRNSGTPDWFRGSWNSRKSRRKLRGLAQLKQRGKKLKESRKWSKRWQIWRCKENRKSKRSNNASTVSNSKNLKGKKRWIRSVLRRREPQRWKELKLKWNWRRRLWRLRLS